jgi:RNA-directed DNA polymerase
VNIGARQRKLSLWALQDKAVRLYDLYGLLCNRVWLHAAYDQVKRNTGSRTAGIDKITATDFEEHRDSNIDTRREELKTQTFTPDPVRRVYIPKRQGQWRPLGIPTLKDRIVQEALRMILAPIWEADFLDCSYGFRPGRSTKDVMSKLHWAMIGTGYAYQWIVEGDRASYFDTIPHQKLMQCVKKRVDDRKIHDLLWKFLRAGVLEKDIDRATLTGTPQGGIISPLLANIYLHELDKYMTRYTELPKRERTYRRRHGLPNFIYAR